MPNLLTFILSFIYGSSSHHDLSQEQLNELRPHFQHWLIGHDASLSALLRTICRFKQERKGGIIVIGAQDQKGTKDELIKKISAVWGEAMGGNGTEPIVVHSEAYTGDPEEYQTLKLDIRECRTMWCKNVTRASHLLSSLAKVRKDIIDKKVLCVVEFDAPVETSEIKSNKVGKLMADKCINLDPKIQTLEDALIAKWREMGVKKVYPDADLISSVTAMKEEATPENLSETVKYAVWRLKKQEAQESETKQQDAGAKEEEPPVKKLKPDVSNSAQKKSNAAFFADSNSNTNTTDASSTTDASTSSTTTTSSANTNSFNTSPLTLQPAAEAISDPGYKFTNIFGIPTENFKSYNKKNEERIFLPPQEYSTLKEPTIFERMSNAVSKSVLVGAGEMGKQISASEMGQEVRRKGKEIEKSLSESISKVPAHRVVGGVGCVVESVCPSVGKGLKCVADIMETMKKGEEKEEADKKKDGKDKKEDEGEKKRKRDQ